MNLYTYCANNPILYVDPSGNFAEALGDIFSEGKQLLSDAWETIKGCGGSIVSSISSNSSAYAGCGAAAAADGPLPFLDIIAIAGFAGLTGYCVYDGVKTYSDATVLPREGTFTKGKGVSLSKVKEKSITKSITIAKTKNKTVPQKKEYSVYGLVDSNKDVMYIGRTKNLASAAYRHSRNLYRTDLKLVPFEQNLSYGEARFLEQYYIDYFQTLNRENKTNNQIRGATEKKYEAYYPEGNSYYQLITGLTENLTYVGG